MRRPRPIADVRGFTMVELLVCLLIMAIMAAIALPAYLDQRAKGEDAEAKLAIRTAAIALEAHHTGEETYNATLADLEAIEPSLTEAIRLRVAGTADTFEIRAQSANTTEFRMSRSAMGTLSRDCTNHGYGLCRAAPDADGNFW